MSHFNNIFVGFDLGSTAAKMVLFQDGNIKHKKCVPSHKFRELIQEVPKSARVFSTGYFRKNVETECSCTEITAAKYGAEYLLGGRKQVQVLVDIGGQDTKVIDLRKRDFILNDKCSAGTGAFLQFMAQYFGVDVNQLGHLHQEANGKRVDINSTCSVFALSEVVSHLVENVPKEVVVAGIHYSFAKRMSYMIPKGVETVGLLGGPALNYGVVETLAEVLGYTVGENLVVLEPSQFVNAIGAVMYGTQQ